MNRLCLQYAVFIAAFHHPARIEGRQPDVALIIYEYACDVRFVGSAFSRKSSRVHFFHFVAVHVVNVQPVYHGGHPEISLLVHCHGQH